MSDMSARFYPSTHGEAHELDKLVFPLMRQNFHQYITGMHLLGGGAGGCTPLLTLARWDAGGYNIPQ